MRKLARLLLVGLTILSLTPSSSRADQTSDTSDDVTSSVDAAAIKEVIQAQIEAFRVDDGVAAMALSSPGIQTMMGHDPEAFMTMVRRGYQPVYRPRSVAFGPLGRSGGVVVQRVDVIGPDGTPHTALYSMEKQVDGTWRISGCTLIDAPAVGA